MAGVAITRRSFAFPMAALLASVVGLAVSAGSAPALAQGATFECPPPGTPTATPAPNAAGGAPAAFPEEGGELTVFAAASLTDAFEQIGEDLEAENPDLAIVYSFAGSQALATQLNEGAEADIFASANPTQMRAAAENGTIAGEPTTFVRNRLAVVVPAGNPAAIDGLDDLGQEELRLVLAQAEVPAGRYARQSVCLAGEDTATYGEGFVDRVAGNVVSEEEDVRQVLTKVQLGEADAGVVYVSDAEVSGDKVEVIGIPDAVNVVASYPIAVVTGGDEALAAAFIGYVLGPDGQATLAEFGFEPVS